MKKHIHKNTGFSLVEFVVVITIFSIMAGVAMFNYVGYRRTIERTNVAQDIALSIRQAQLYGISAGDGLIGNADFFSSVSSYNVTSGSSLFNIVQDRSIRGVSIDQDTGVITIFADNDRNNMYDDGSDRVIDKRTIISNDISIGSFCFDELLGTCGSTETSGVVDITFERPRTDATVIYKPTSGSPTVYNSVGLVIEATDEEDAQVDVSALGRISVK